MKATHKGHCQVCGHLQKLPKSKLSKHGYTTRCGFFEGVCFGAEHLPFEQDKSLIETAIRQAKERAVALSEQATAVEASTDPNNVVYRAFLEGNKWERGYRLLAGRVEEREEIIAITGYKYKSVWFLSSSPVMIRSVMTPYAQRLRLAGIHDIKSAVETLNASEAWRLRKLVAEAESYIKWQQDRIKDWKPQPLIEI